MIDLNVVVTIVTFLWGLEQLFPPREKHRVKKALLRLALSKGEGGIGVGTARILLSIFPANWRGVKRLFSCSLLLSVVALAVASLSEEYQLAWQAYGSLGLILQIIEFVLLASAVFTLAGALSLATVGILNGRALLSIPVFLVCSFTVSMLAVVVFKTLVLVPLNITRGIAENIRVPIEVKFLTTPEGYVQATVARKVTDEERRLLTIIKTWRVEERALERESRESPKDHYPSEPQGYFSYRALSALESEDAIFQRITKTLSPSDVCGRPVGEVLRTILAVVSPQIEFSGSRRVDCPAMATYASAAIFNSVITPGQARLEWGFKMGLWDRPERFYGTLTEDSVVFFGGWRVAQGLTRKESEGVAIKKLFDTRGFEPSLRAIFNRSKLLRPTDDVALWFPTFSAALLLFAGCLKLFQWLPHKMPESIVRLFFKMPLLVVGLGTILAAAIWNILLTLVLGR